MSSDQEATEKVDKFLKTIGKDQKVVFVSGNFNIIHPGHQRLFSFAKELGDLLVIGVTKDETSGVMFPQELRAEGLKALSCVDHVISMSGDLKEILLQLKPEVVVKGKEHEGRENLEAEVVKSYGGTLLFGSGNVEQSSIEMIAKDFEYLDEKVTNKPLAFLDRHSIDYHKLNSIVKSFSKVKALVIGDTIADKYITCEPLGLSQEDPTIVVTPRLTKQFIGGAAIVASHAKGLGADVKFYSVVGRDETGEYVGAYLKEQSVDAHLVQDKTRPTTLKERYRANNKTLLRVSHLRQHSIDDEITKNLLEALEKDIPSADVVLFSDFNYGCLPQKLVDRVGELCKANNVKMVADSQSSSQVGDISRFKGMELITPTEREARLGVNDFESGLVVLCEKLRKKCGSKNVFITLASDGLLIDAPAKPGEHAEGLEHITDRLPALNSSAKDSAGAGDSLFVTTSLALAAGASIWEAGYLGALAASVQVGRLGNFPLTPKDLIEESLI